MVADTLCVAVGALSASSPLSELTQLTTCTQLSVRLLG